MCESSLGLLIVYYLRIIMSLIKYIVPIGLVISCCFTFFKEVINNEDKLSSAIKLVSNKLIAGVIIFILPSFITFSLSLLGDMVDSKSSYDECYNTVDMDMIKHYEQIEKEEFDKKIAVYDIDKYKNNIQNNLPNTSYNGGSTNYTNQKMEKNGVVLDLGNVNVISNVKPQQLSASLVNKYGSKGENFVPFVNSIVSLENKYGINAFVLIGIMAQETGWLKADIATMCNNVGSIRYTNQLNATECSFGNSGGKFAKYNSKDLSMDALASMLHKYYLIPGAVWYEGNSVSDISIHYCGSAQSWINLTSTIAKDLFEGAV